MSGVRRGAVLARLGAGLRRAFTDNLALKGLSAILTLILYFLVQQDTINEFSVSMPIALENLPRSRVFVGDLPPEVRVRIKGRWSRIIKAVEQTPKPYPIDLEGLQDGDTYRFNSYSVQEHLGVEGIDVVSTEPALLTVQLDRFLSKLVPVKPVLRGEPREGYEVDLIEVKPSSVWVEGPHLDVTSVFEVETVPIDVGGLDRALRSEVPLETPSRRFVKYQTNRVTVEIPVRERIYEATYRGLAMRVAPCPRGYICRVDPPVFELRLLGKYFTVEKMVDQDLSAMVQIRRDAVPGDTGVFEGIKPSVDNPPDVIVHVKPEHFRVVIQKLRDLREEPRREPMIQGAVEDPPAEGGGP